MALAFFFEDIKNMGNIGSAGKWSTHCYRDLQHILPPMGFSMPKPTLIPFKSMVAPFYEYADQHIMWPHEMFSHLYHLYKGMWDEFVYPGADVLASFWEQMQGHPQLGHPSFAARPDFRDKGIPIRFHGDGVPTTGIAKSWGKMLNVFHWSSMIASGSTREMCMYVWAFWETYKSKTPGHMTYHHFMQKLKWSFECLWTGRWSEKDENDVMYPDDSDEMWLAKNMVWLADGFFGILFSIQSDNDFFSDCFGFPRWNSGSPCAFCPCTQQGGLMPWDNFQTVPDLAPWMNLCFDVAHFLTQNPFANPLFEVSGVSALTAQLDFMHVKYLGSDQYLYGSVLFLIVYRLMPDGNAANNLTQIWEFIKEFYKNNKDICRCPYKMIKLSMFSSGPGGYPKLKGKAAEVRDLGPALLAAWKFGMTEGDVFHLALLGALEASCRMDEILRQNKHLFCLPPAAAQEFMEQARVYIQQQVVIHNYNGDRLFNLTFKHSCSTACDEFFLVRRSRCQYGMDVRPR